MGVTLLFTSFFFMRWLHPSVTTLHQATVSSTHIFTYQQPVDSLPQQPAHILAALRFVPRCLAPSSPQAPPLLGLGNERDPRHRQPPSTSQNWGRQEETLNKTNKQHPANLLAHQTIEKGSLIRDNSSCSPLLLLFVSDIIKTQD